MSRSVFKLILYFYAIVPIFFARAPAGETDQNAQNSELLNRIFEFDGFSSALMFFLEFKKNIIVGWPLSIVVSFLDQLCTSTLFIQYVPPSIVPDVDEMNFMYITPCRNYSSPLLNAEQLETSLQTYKEQQQVVILATGWTDTVNNSATLFMLSEAFLCRNDTAFIIVDVGKYVDTLYTWAAINSEEIGKNIGVGLMHLLKIVPLQNIHLVGHSLGAHVMGSAARHFTKLTGLLIPRVTGLDPAKPCFRFNKTIHSLQRGDAAFVDIIHSNNGVLAKSEAMGDVDFYPGGANPLPPGCYDISCAHSRAVEFFAESVYPGNERNFIGIKCPSYKALTLLDCDASSRAVMGYKLNKQNKGIYYVDVNRKSPFGKNAKHMNNIWETSNCNVCKTPQRIPND